VHADHRFKPSQKAISLTWIKVCGRLKGTIFFLVEEQEEDDDVCAMPSNRARW
jgi:hypothetical protein